MLITMNTDPPKKTALNDSIPIESISDISSTIMIGRAVSPHDVFSLDLPGDLSDVSASQDDSDEFDDGQNDADDGVDNHHGDNVVV